MAIYGERFFTATLLGSGYAAVEMVWVVEEDDGKKAGYWDVWQTGVGRYTHPAEAQTEAMELAEAEGVPFRSGVR